MDCSRSQHNLGFDCHARDRVTTAARPKRSYSIVARSTLRWDWPRVHAALTVIALLLKPVRPLTRNIHTGALKLARNSALRKFGGVTVENPFFK